MWQMQYITEYELGRTLHEVYGAEPGLVSKRKPTGYVQRGKKIYSPRVTKKNYTEKNKRKANLIHYWTI